MRPSRAHEGQWNAKAFVQGGRKQARQGLSVPALLAMRFNPDQAASYGQLIEAGRAPGPAITANMRKRGILANALLKRSRASTRALASPSRILQQAVETVF